MIVDGAVLHAANYPLPAGAAVTVTDGGEIDLGGATATVASLMLVSGSVVDGTLQVGGGVQVESGTISASLEGGSGLLKTGNGVATLSGRNTSSDGTVVSGGRLIVNSPAALLAGSSLTVGNAAAFAPRIAAEASVTLSADRSYPALPASTTIAVGAFLKRAADSSAGAGSHPEGTRQGAGRDVDGPEVARSTKQGGSSATAGSTLAAPATVARLTRTADCVWDV